MPRAGEAPAGGAAPTGAGSGSDRRDEAGRGDGGDGTDDAFLALVARFEEEPDERAWPESEDISGPRRPNTLIIRPTGRIDVPPDTDNADRGDKDHGRVGSADLFDDDTVDGLAELAGPSSAGDADDADGADGADGTDGPGEGHYRPPPPPPVPRMRPVTKWALGSIALGMAILFVPAMFGLARDRSQDVVSVLLILGGVGTLVARLGERPPTDSDGPDDGAVV